MAKLATVSKIPTASRTAIYARAAGGRRSVVSGFSFAFNDVCHGNTCGKL
jgi:hypothetical protein